MKNRFLLLVFLLCYSCANVRSPGGGPKDGDPPKVVLAVPTNQSVAFNSQTIYLEFDEYVEMNDIYNQLIISPPLQTRPDIKMKKKGIYIKLNEVLRSNTTYTFNFGGAIRDVNEGNILKDYVYVFSTGALLDSLVMAGKVEDAYTNLPVDGVRVMLYESYEDSIPYQEKPLYFGITNDQGEYQVKHLKAGKYKAFALLDMDGDFLYDAGESMSFSDSLIASSQPDSTLVKVDFRMSKSTDAKQFLTGDYADSTGFLSFQLLKPPSKLSFEAIGYPQLQSDFYDHQDSITFWLEGPPIDETFDLVIRDDQNILDTLPMDFYSIGVDTKKEIGLSLQSESNTGFRTEDAISFRSSRIIATIDTSKIMCSVDSVPFPIVVEQGNQPYEYLVKGQFKDGAKYKVLMLPGAFISREGISNDTISLNAVAFESDHYGELELNISGLNEGVDYVLEFFNKNEVIREAKFSNDTLISWSRIYPGMRSIRMFVDENSNGIWDPGNYLEGIQPERMIYLPEELHIRSNWQVSFDWKLE